MKKHKKSYKLRAICFAIGIVVMAHLMSPMSDNYIRSRVVRLMGDGHMCSGEQVRAPSGKDYILSAAHCLITSKDGQQVNIITESGKSIQRRIIAEDPMSDLLLIEGLPNLEGLPIADHNNKFQHVRTFTHGHNMDTYMTEGALIQDSVVTVPIYPIQNDAEALKCSSMPKNKIATNEFYGTFCLLVVQETATTANIVPGSSGGVIVDSRGYVVGVASSIDGFFGYLVRLKDIKAFLSGY